MFLRVPVKQALLEVLHQNSCDIFETLSSKETAVENRIGERHVAAGTRQVSEGMLVVQ